MLRWLLMTLSLASAATAAPLVIGHRGASGERPEHTLASYERAIEEGADFIEPDLVMTKDGVLIVRHENEISGTTDVAKHPEFATRRTTKMIDGQSVTGWFTEDFTLAEIKTLRARARLPQLRPDNAKFDGQFEIATFDEVIALAKAHKVGVYPEMKHGSYFESLNLDMVLMLRTALQRAGWTKKTDPVFVQSFEVENLRRLRSWTRIRLVQLIDATGGPADKPNLQYADMVKPAGLKVIAEYADAIGPAKALIVPRDSTGKSMTPTTLVADAHAVGLKVHPWTFRAENVFLPAELRKSDSPAAHGDVAAEIKQFYALGVDGVFSDFPGIAVTSRPK